MAYQVCTKYVLVSKDCDVTATVTSQYGNAAGIARGIAVLCTYHDLMIMYLVCTCTYLLLLLSQALQDFEHPPADLDIDRGYPCPEDGEFFDRPDAATMEEAISQSMYAVHTKNVLAHKSA